MELNESLYRIFNPDSVAVIGASSNPLKPGFMCTSSLVKDGFKGRIYPVNPALSELLGLKVYRSVLDIPGKIDLAVSVVPAEQALAVTGECIAKGASGIVMVSAGFAETGTEAGLALQQKLHDTAEAGGIRIIGPNTAGLVNTRAALNATFSPGLGLVKPGRVSIVSQSGGMCIYLVNALTGNNTGIGKVIGMGNRCNLDFDEMVTYLAEDEETGVIVLYLEGIDSPGKLMKAAEEAVRKKPVIVFKGGRSDASSSAARSHTGAIAGKYELYRAAFTQSGMITAGSLTELADMTKALSLQPPGNGSRVAILSLQAGPGIIAADKAAEYGLKLAALSQDTRQRLRKYISPLLSIDNPVDMAWTGSSYEASRAILDAVLEDEGVDAVIVAFISFELSRELPKAIIDSAAKYRKPVVACIGSIGFAGDTAGMLDDAGIPAYAYPDRACSGVAGLLRYGEVRRRSVH